MKRLLKISVILLMAVMAYSCQKDGSKEVEGEYVLQSNSLTINNSIVNVSDYVGAAVKVDPAGDGYVNITLENIILGNPSVVFEHCELIQTKASYSFDGSLTLGTSTYTIEGTIVDKEVSLNLTVVNSSPLMGKWMIGAKETTFLGMNMTLPDLYVTASGSALPKQIIIKGDTIIVEEVLPLLGFYVSSAFVSYAPFKYIEFAEPNLFNFSSSLLPTEYASFSSGLLQFYEADNLLYLYFKKSVTDMINLVISQYVTIPSPFTFPFAYKAVSKTSLNIEINQSTLKPLLTTVVGIIDQFSYAKLKTLDPDTEMTEAEYNAYVATIKYYINIMGGEGINYAIGMNLIPYQEGSRPWDSLK